MILRRLFPLPTVNMPKHVEHRLYPPNCSEKLAASLMLFRAGSLIQDAVGRAVADDVGGGGNFVVDFGEASFGEVECAPERELPGTLPPKN